MNGDEARKVVESWDVVSAANVLKAYENGELLRPVDRDADVAIATNDLQDLCYELLDNLMPEICGKAYWCRDKDWRKCEYHEGDIIDMQLRVVPSSYYDLVTVCVQRTQVTNLRDGCYSPKRITDWSKEYTFQEFKESPFYQMCIDVWSDRSGLATKLYWDTHLMDEHEVFDDDTRWGVYAHVYEHHRTWLGNWDKTGCIEAVDFSLDEDGNIEMGLSRNGKRECFYDGDVWTLADIIDEHEQMREQLKKLKEHGIDLDDGTLSIKLWE